MKDAASQITYEPIYHKLKIDENKARNVCTSSRSYPCNRRWFILGRRKMKDVSKQISAGSLDYWKRIECKTTFKIRDKIRIDMQRLVPILFTEIEDAIMEKI